jgi:hypothetical protein
MASRVLAEDVHVVLPELILAVLEQIEGLLVVLVGLFQFVLEGEVEALLEAEVEGQLRDVLHSCHVSRQSVHHGHLAFGEGARHSPKGSYNHSDRTNFPIIIIKLSKPCVILKFQVIPCQCRQQSQETDQKNHSHQSFAVLIHQPRISVSVTSLLDPENQSLPRIYDAYEKRQLAVAQN